MDPDAEVLIECIETAFETKFSPRQLGNDPTFEQVFGTLRSSQTPANSHRCLTSIMFWRLRRKLMEMLNLPKNAIQLDTSIESLIPPARRREVWQTIGRELDLRLPGLEYPSWVAWLIMPVIVGPPISTGIWIDFSGASKWLYLLVLPILIAAAFLAKVLGDWLLQPFAVKLPPQTFTIRDLVRTMVGLNHGKLAREFGPSTHRELWSSLQFVVRYFTAADYYWREGEDVPLTALVGDDFRGDCNVIERDR
jgi:hypothetical protein